MQNLEQSLTEEFTRLEHAPLPMAEDVLARVGRRRRRRSGALAATSAAVVLVLLGAAVGLGLTRGGRPSIGEPTPTPSSRRAGFVITEPIGTFVDGRTGFLNLDYCRIAARACGPSMIVTVDGGRTWYERSIPRYLVDGAISTNALAVFGADAIVSLLSPSYGRPEQVAISHDAGRTWHDITAAFMPRIHAVPAGARLAGVDGTHVGVLLPDGRFGFLAVGPGAVGFHLDQTVVTAAGVIVELGTRPGDTPADPARTDLWVSRDRGVTWQRSSVPVVRDGLTQTRLYTTDGTHVYVLAQLSVSGPPPVWYRLYRSGDAGVTWHQVDISTLPGIGTVPTLEMVTAAATADGGLLIATERGRGHLAPGPAGLQVDPGRPAAFAGLTDGSVLGIGGPVDGVDGALWFSVDGRTWRPVVMD